MATKYEFYYDNDNTAGAIPVWDVNDAFAQTFTPNITHLITEIRLKLYRSSTPGILHINIYAVDENHFPTGLSLASGTTNGDSLGTSSPGGYRTIILSTTAILQATTEYALVLTAPNGIPGSKTVFWRLDIADATYAGGWAIKYLGTVGDPTPQSWQIYGVGNVSDFMFSEWGSAAPSKPTNPSPANDATGIDFSERVLDWDGTADFFDVYMGPSGNLSLIVADIVPSTYTVDLVDIPTEQVIYWRVDAKNAAGTTTGDVWNFDARPVKANTPVPTDTASDITLDESPLSWIDGGNSDTYEIYFREQGDDWSLVGEAQAGIEYVLSFGTLDYGITYEWRIDSTNNFGTTTGDTWNFDTITFNTILPGDSGGAGGGGGGGGAGEESSPTGENNMITLRRLVAAANSKIWYEDI